jgi:hypothetical protein
VGHNAFQLAPGPRPPLAGGSAISFESVKRIDRVGGRIKLDGRVIAVTNSSAMARDLLEFVNEVSSLRHEDRQRRIEEEWSRYLDDGRVRSRIAEVDRAAIPVRWLSNLCFVYLSVVVPLTMYELGAAGTWIPLGVGLGIVMLATALTLFVKHRSLHPLEQDDRWRSVLLVGLSPLSTPRAADALWRGVTASHPLAVARVLCDANDFRTFARRVLLDARSPLRPLSPQNDALTAEIVRWHHALASAALASAIQRWGLDIESLTSPPLPADSLQRSYCPRCESQYVILEGRCDDCGGIPLRAFERDRAETLCGLES